MNFRNNKKIAIIMAIVVLSLALATTSFAADSYKSFTAWVGEMKIFHNGTEVQLKDKPLIINDTTYLPVRSVSEMLGMDVTWDQVNKHVGINDKPGTSYSDMQNKFIVQEVKIIELEAKVKDLEEKLKVKIEEEAKVTTLSELEKQLNKDHSSSSRVKFDIRLYGSTKDVEVRIYVENDRGYYNWDSLATNEQERYIQDIVDDILREFTNAKVSGYVENNSTYGRLTSFIVSSRGTVSLGTSSGGIYKDLEDDLNYEFVRTLTGITNIKAYEGGRYVELTIDVNNSDWDYKYISGTEKAILEEIADYIVKYYGYGYTDISGLVYVKNGTTSYFDFNAYGDVIVK